MAYVLYGKRGLERLSKKKRSAFSASEIDSLIATAQSLHGRLETLRQDYARKEAELQLAAMAESARIGWLDTNAASEIKIERDHGGGVRITRWFRRYVSFHAWGGATLREALDAAVRES